MPISPLRPQGDLFDERDLVEATLPASADVRRGLASAGAGISNTLLADEALRAEAARGAADPETRSLRDAALAGQERAQMLAPRLQDQRQIRNLGDAVDFAQAGVASGITSSLPSLAGALLTRGRSPGLAYAGAAVPGYWQNRGEAALTQYSDPELAAKSVEERDRAATGVGLVSGGLEAIVPGALANAGLRRLGTGYLGNVGKGAAAEYVTEGAQDLTAQTGEQYLDPSREYDFGRAANAATLGALGGGGLTAAMGAPGAVVNAVGDSSGELAGKVAGMLPDMSRLPGLREGPATDGAPIPVPPSGPTDPAGTGSLLDSEPVKRAKDFFSETAERFQTAADEATSPKDFLKRAFGDPAENAADEILLGDNDASLAGVTEEQTLQNLERRSAENEARARDFAAQLLESENTPDDVKQRIASLGDNFADPQAQRFIAQTLTIQRAGERFERAKNDLIDGAKELGQKVKDFAASPKPKELLDRAREGVENVAREVQDRVVSKKNLMDTSPQEQAAFEKTVFDLLTPEAQRDRRVRNALPELANSILAYAAKTGDITKEDMATIAKVRAASEDLFANPTEAATAIMEFAGTPRLDVGKGKSFFDRVFEIGAAQEDIKNPNSFLYTALPDEVRNSMTTKQLKQLARMVDEFSVTDLDPRKGDKALVGLAVALGGYDNARMVVDFYGQQNEAQLATYEDDAVDPQAKLTETELKMTPAFRAPNQNRPFLRGRDDDAVQARLTEAGGAARVASLDKFYGSDPDESLSFRAKMIRSDLVDRIEKASQRDTKSVQEKIKLLESRPELTDDQRAELASLKTRKTEDRQDLPALRAELEAQDAAAVAAKRAGKDPSAARLALYDTVLTEEDDTRASDARVAKFRALLDRMPNTQVGTIAERAAKREAAEKLKKTAIGFKMKDGRTMNLSAEGMIYNSTSRGSRAEKLSASIAEVLARQDVEGFVTPSPDTVVLRGKGDAKDLTWGEIAPQVTARKLTDKERKDVAEQKSKKEFAREARSKADAENTASMEEALSAAKSPTEALQTAIGWAENILLPKLAEAEKSGKRNYALESKMRVLTDFINDKLEIVYPDPDRAELVERMNEYLESAGIQTDDTNQMSKILIAEERLDVMRERLEAVREVPSIAEKLSERIDKDQTALDQMIDRTPLWQRVEDLPTRQRDVAGSSEDTKARAAAEKARIEGLAKSKKPSYVSLADREAARIKSLTAAERRTELADAQERLTAAEARGDKERVKELNRKIEMLNEKGSKKSLLQPKPGRPGKLDEKALIDEVIRLRGPDIKVAFDTFKEIGGSGEYTFDRATKERLIKIATNASNPMSVAWHESIHDFMTMLGTDVASRSIKKDLLDASNAPHVKRKLRELLAAHPKAREQMESDPEERLAYMYQFWAEGVLNVGPTGTGILSKIRDLFRDLFGIVGRDERALDLLTAFRDGKFSDPSVVAEVLEDMKTNRLGNKIEMLNPALVAGLRKLYQAAPDRLREYQNDAFNKIADMFSSEEGKLGFIQRRFQQGGKWENRLAGILENTTAVERKTALTNMQSMKKPSTKLERELAKYFKDAHQYMLDSDVKTFDPKNKKWVPVRQVENYFPRVFDRKIIDANRDEWMKLLTQYVPVDEANKITRALTSGSGQLDLAENEHALGYTPYAQAVQNRALTFIDETNADKFAKFQQQDITDILLGYTKQMVHRAEYAKMFGNNGEELTRLIKQSGVTDQKILDDVGKTVRGLEGTLGDDLSPATKELMSGVMTLQNLVLLPLAIFSQMVDPIMIAARSGEVSDAGKAYMTALTRLKNTLTKNGKTAEGEELAEMLDIINQDSVLEATGVAYGSTYMSANMRKANKVFFKYNGMQGWNNSMRIAATAAGERYILKNKDNAGVLRELGLQAKDIKQDKATGRLKINEPIREAMFRFTDGAVLRPSSSQRPVWMSDPKWMLIAHLKQFTFAMHNVVLKRATKQLENEENVKPWATLLLALPTILAADMAKFALTGGAPASWEFKDYVGHAVSRSGLLGIGAFGGDVLQDPEFGKMPGESLLGPSAENLTTILRWMGDDARTDFGDVVDRTVPGARLI